MTVVSPVSNAFVYLKQKRFHRYSTAAVFSGAVFCIGVTLDNQSALIISLGDALGNGIFGTFWSVTLATCWVSLFTALTSYQLDMPFWHFTWANDERPPFYEFLAGPLGMLFIIAGSFLPKYIGFALFSILSVSGQISMSVILDHVAFMDIPRQRISYQTALCMMIIVTGILISAYERINIVPLSTGVFFGYCVISYFAGFVLPLQAAMNGRVARRLIPRQPIRAAFINFMCSWLFFSDNITHYVGRFTRGSCQRKVMADGQYRLVDVFRRHCWFS